jgi:hypothetical protein
MGITITWDMTSASNKDYTATTTNPDAAPTATPRMGGFVLRNRWNGTNLVSGNTWDATLSGASLVASQTVNRVLVLEVPRRVAVNDIKVYGVTSATVPNHQIKKNASSATWSTAAALKMNGNFGLGQFSAYAYRQNGQTTAHSFASKQGSSSATVGGYFGAMTYSGNTAANYGKFVANGLQWAMEKIDSSITAPFKTFTDVSWHGLQGGLAAAALSAATSTGVEAKWHPNLHRPAYFFPFGGYVTFHLGPLSVAASSASVAGSGASNGKFTGTWEIQANANYIPE